MNETNIKHDIMIKCADIAWLTNEVTGNFFTMNGSRIKVGFEGKPDVLGFRLSDGKFICLETKAAKGKLRQMQERFRDAMKPYPIIYGMPRSAEEARRIIEESD